MGSYDSRWSAIQHYKPAKSLRRLFNTSTFLGNVLIALGITYLIPADHMSHAMELVLFLTILAVGLWITEAIPPFAVGIFIIAFLVFSLGSDYFLEVPMPVSNYVGTWTSDVIWLLMGGFFLAEGMKKVKLDRSLFRYTVRRFGKKPKRLLFGMMIMTGLASMVMSNTATAAMMISSIMPLVTKLGKGNAFTRALMIGIPAAASVGGLGTIIGSTPNAIAVGALETVGIKISFLTWMLFGLPLGLLLIRAFWKYLCRTQLMEEISIDLSFLEEEPEYLVPLREKRIVIFTLIATILLWSTEILHGIPLAATSAVPIVVLTLTRIISAEDVRALPWDTLMLVAGGLALGLAIVDVGLADTFLGFLDGFSFPIWLLAIIFGLLTLGVSNVMSNTAAAAILIPVSLGVEGMYQIAIPLMVALFASCALYLPVSTPPNAIAYSTGLIDQKDFRISGAYFVVLSPFLIFPISILIGYLILNGYTL